LPASDFTRRKISCIWMSGLPRGQGGGNN